MYEKLIIRLDDFFADPYQVRERASELEFATPPSQLDPKVRGPIAEFVTCDDATRGAALEKVRPHLPSEIEFAVTEFRFIHSRTIKRNVCHADGPGYAGVVHLTLPEYCQGGTVFFRHKPTGDYWYKPENQARYNFDDVAEWEETYRAPMVFNRLAFYPGRLFHAVAVPYFGDSLQNGRLTLTMFAELKDKECLDRKFDKLASQLADQAVA